MEWLLFIAGLGLGVAIGWHLKPDKPDNDEAIKQSISDKLDKAIQDIKNTI